MILNRPFNSNSTFYYYFSDCAVFAVDRVGIFTYIPALFVIQVC